MANLSLRSIYRNNLSTLRRQPLAEISGSLGDLGTFLPIVIALAEGGQISVSTTLVFSGIFNILTGACFGIPLPVQPMKAIAAVAILKSLSAGETQAAGLFVASCILFLSITGLLKWFAAVIPVPVVKGIQVGAGLSLMIAAGGKALTDLSWVAPSWADNYLWIIAAFMALLMVTSSWLKISYAVIITVLGIVFAGIETARNQERAPGFRLWRPTISNPSGADWKIGIVDAGIGQLPLTTLNSIIAVVYLAGDLLPDIATPSVTAIGISVAAMNLIGCWFGSMPLCHGSGGLAAQYRFGARSGASVIILGIFKFLLGITLGDSLMALLRRFPTALLTVMVVAAGLELASVGESLNTDQARDLKSRSVVSNNPSKDQRKERWNVMLVTAGLLVAFKNDAVGFAAGMLCQWSYQLSHLCAKRQESPSMNRSDEEEPHTFLQI